MSEWKPYTFEDGTEVHLMGFNASALEGDRVWAFVTLAFIAPDGTETYASYAREPDELAMDKKGAAA